jgi:1-acyl-sn-glycerol-3-phosphate acyltransferase
VRAPTSEQLALLEGFERTAFAIADTVNRRPALKRASHAFLKSAGAAWVYHCTKHLVRIFGEEHLRAVAPDRGVILISNHRSFFDMYLLSSVVLRRTSWIRGMYFPVRGEYFYERPDGVFVNLIMSAFAMYPPVLRDPKKRAFNGYTVDAIADVLREPGTLVGFHPEGTRNKTDDPYTLLPANPGVGQVVHAARPIVLPAFILGLGNHLPRQIASNFTRTGDPITIQFAPPLDLERFYAQPARLRTYKHLADHLRDELQKLGHETRALREEHGLPTLAPSVASSADAQPRRARDASV